MMRTIVLRGLAVFLLGALGVLGGGVCGAGEEGDPIAAAIAEARGLVDNGRPAAAIEHLKALDRPGDVRVAHMLGVAYYHANDPGRAIATLAPIVEELPEGSLERREAVQVLGLSHYLAGHIAEAVPLLERTRLWAAGNAELTYILGTAYIQTRESAKARECFADLFRVRPDSASAHLLTAQMMVRLELEELAEAELRLAIEKEPKIPRAHFLLGQIALFRGRLDEAIALTQREIELSPGDAIAFSQLGDALVRQQKWDDAIAALQKSLWLNPYYSAPYILLGKAYTRKQQPGTAEGMFREAVGRDPNNRAAHYLLGQLLQQMGRADEARRELEIAERLQGEPAR